MLTKPEKKKKYISKSILGFIVLVFLVSSPSSFQASDPFTSYSNSILNIYNNYFIKPLAEALSPLFYYPPIIIKVPTPTITKKKVIPPIPTPAKTSTYIRGTTYITNNYPTTTIYQTISGGSGGGNIDTSSFVTRSLFDKQTLITLDSAAKKVSDLAQALGDKITTNILNISGNATVGGDLTVSSLTATRIIFAGAGGLLSDDAGFIFTAASDQLLLGEAGTDGSLKIYSEDGAIDHSTTFNPGNQTQDITYTLPVDDGGANEFLQTDGAGILTWASGGSSGTVTSVSGTANRITSTGGTTPVIDISSSYVGQTSLTTLGTVTTGTLSTGAIIGGVTMTLGSDATGDMYYRNSSGVLTRIATANQGSVLRVGGSSVPSFGQVDLADTDAITGVLPVSNGGTGAATLNDLIILGTQTTGNYVATLTSGNGISATATGEGSTPTLTLAPLTADWNQTGAFNITLNNSSAGLKILENGASPTLFGIFDVADLSASDKIYTFPDSSGTVILSGHTLTSDVTGTLSATGSTVLTIANLSVTNAKINDVAWSKVTGTPTTLGGYGITDALSNSSSSTQDGHFGDIFLQDDTTPSHYLQITDAENLTGAHSLSLSVGNADRTLTISGNSIISGTNTGDVTLAGENYLSIAGQVITANPVNLSGTHVTGILAAARFPALTGDVTTSAGSLATTIGSDKILESMLKAVNSPSDELCLTYESTVGDFEWQSCAASSMTSFTLAGTSGTPQSITDGNTLTIAAGTGITTTAGATDTVTVGIDQSTNFAWTGIHSYTNTLTATSSQTDFNLTLGNDGDADTISAVNIDVTSLATSDADIVYGINIADLTSADATVLERAIHIGANWDNVIDNNGVLISASELNILDGGILFAEISSTPTTLAGYGITDALSNSTSSTQDGYFGDIYLKDDTTPSHYLQITDAENLTANHSLSISTGNADRTLTISGNSTISGTNTGDQTITLTGDVTGGGTGSFVTTIANSIVTYSKIQNVTTNRLLGRATAGSGVMEEITLGTGLSYTGTTLNVTGSALGSITVATGTSGSDFNISGSPVSLGGTVTLNIPDAGASARGLVNTTTQTFAGAKTFSSDAVVHTLTVGLGAGSVATNTALGVSALSSNTTGVRNTAIGYQTMLNHGDSGSVDDVAIGYQALKGDATYTGSLNVAIGSSSMAKLTTGFSNVGIGVNTLANDTTGARNMAIGKDSLGALTTGSSNVAVGNTAMGAGVVTGDSNVAVGQQALKAITSGNNNVGIGQDAGLAINTGTYNMAIGAAALSAATNGLENVAVGASAIRIGNASYTTVIGSNALSNNNSGTGSVTGGTIIGAYAGKNNDVGSDYNTFVGYSAGRSFSTGANNIVIGAYPEAAGGAGGQTWSTGSKNIQIGYNLLPPSGTSSNTLNIGNLIFGTGMSGTGTTIAGNIAIGLTAPTARLHLAAGTATASTAPLKFTSGTNLTTAEAGAMEWDGTNLFITQTTGPTRKTIAYTSDLTGYVTSVSGTSPIISSGGTTPAISLAGLTGLGSANQILGMNNAGTAYEYKTVSTSGTAVSNDVGVTLSGANALVINLPSASATVRGVLTSTDWSTFNSKESALTFSTGLTRSTNTITSNLSTGVSGGQSAIGGTGTGDALTLIGTTANGTSTTASLIFKVGNNGGTKGLDILNNGLVRVGAGPTTTSGYGLVVDQPDDGTDLKGIFISANNHTTGLSIGYDKISQTGILKIEGLGGVQVLGASSAIKMVMTSAGLFEFGSSTTPTSQLQVNKDQNSVTQSDANGIFLANATAATAGTQSISPGIVLQGNGWKTQSTAASQDVRFRIDVLPVQAFVNPTGNLNISANINGAGYTNLYTFKSDGTFSASTVNASTVLATSFLGSIGIVAGTSDGTTSRYRTTNGGSNILPAFDVWTGLGGPAGTPSTAIDSINGLVFAASNGTNDVSRAGINITNLGNTAGSESGDLIFSTQSGGTAMSEKMRIMSTGNVGIGDTTPNSLFTVGNGDLFQINSTGQIGSQQAPVSDYLFALAGTSGNDNSRVIDITQTNDAGEDNYGLYINNTSNLGTISGTNLNARGTYTLLTPTAALAVPSGAKFAKFFGNDVGIDTSNLSLGNSAGVTSGQAFGVNIIVTGTPDVTDTTTAGSNSMAFYGINSAVSVSPTFSSSTDTLSVSGYAGFFNNTIATPNDALIQSNQYGLSVSSTGNLGTAGTTAHYGGYFFAGGTADTNYGILVEADSATTNNYGVYINFPSAASTNYALYSAATAQSYFAGSVGIGTASAATKLSVAPATAYAAPTLGTASGAFSILGDNGLYGLYAGVSTSGNTWLQTMRNDAATAYDLLLNPSGGNVGIGTTTPGANLDIVTAGTGDGIRLTGSATLGTTSGAGIKLYTNTSPSAADQRLGSVFFGVFDGTTATNASAITGWSSETWGAGKGSYLRFETTATGGTTRSEKMRIDPSGNVGIGSTTFTYGTPLEIAGAGYASIAIRSTSGVIGIMAANSNSELRLGTASNHPIDFRIANSTAMYLSTSGNLGIGTTSPNAKLSFSNNVATGFLDNYSEYQALLYDGGNATTGAYGLGIKGNTMVFNSGGGAYSFDRGGSTTTMELDTAGAAKFYGDLYVLNGYGSFYRNTNDTTPAANFQKDITEANGFANYTAMGSQLNLTSTNHADQGYVSASAQSVFYTGSGSSTFAGEIRSLNGAAYNNGTTNVGSMVSNFAGGGNLTTGTITANIGFKASFYSPGAGAIINNYGFYSEGDSTITGSVTNGYGFVANAGTKTNEAGIAILDQGGSTGNVNVLLGTTTIPAGNWNIYASSTRDNYFAGRIGIGDSTPDYGLDVVADINSDDCFREAGTQVAGTCASDERLKQNIEPLTGSLEKITALNPVSFEWKEGIDQNLGIRYVAGRQVGLIAQEVQNIFPNLVKEKNGFLAVEYNLELQMETINAIKELDLKVQGMSSLDTTKSNSLGSLIKQFLADVGNGVENLYASVIHSDRVETKTLCVGNTCVTEEQFLQMVQQSGNQNNNGGVGGGTPTPPPTPPADICPNIDGNQATIPDGYHTDEQGSCIADEVTLTPDPTPEAPPAPPPAE